MAVVIIFWRAIEKFIEDGGPAIASHLALSLLLSLFPFLILTATVIGVWGDEALVEQVIHLIFDNWPAETAKPLADQVTAVIRQSQGDVFSLSSVVALYLASNGVEAAREGLNLAYKVKETRHWAWRRVQGFVFVIVGASALIGAALALVAAPFGWAFAVSRFPALAEFSFSFAVLRYGLALSLLTLALFAFHRFLPATHLPFRRMVWGVAFTVFAIIVGSSLFGTYLKEIANYSALYAGLAGTMVTIIYLYVLSLLIVFGGDLNTAIAEADAIARAKTYR